MKRPPRRRLKWVDFGGEELPVAEELDDDWFEHVSASRQKDWPELECRKPDHRMLMEAKLNAALDRIMEQEVIKNQEAGLPESFWTRMAWERKVAEAKAALKTRDVETLARLTATPEGARALTEARDHKARPGPKRRRKTDIKLAASREIDHVRQIWREVYGREKREREITVVTVEEIIARRYRRYRLELTAKELKAYRKKHGQPK
jgi:hypothetical protein